MKNLKLFISLGFLVALVHQSSQRSFIDDQVIQGEGKATYECGLANSLSTGRITGGSETLANQYPWVAHLRVFFWSGDSAMCTGTLINQQWILTAAHCTYGVVNVTVTLGAHDITTFNANQQVFYVSRTWNIHPQWRYGDVENDIALIQLPRAVNINNYVRPACMPYSDDPDMVNESVTMVGWGNFSSTPNSGVSPVLRSVRSNVIDSSGTGGSCQQSAALGSFRGDRVICSSSSSNRHFCHGDDGGPMTYYNSFWRTHTVIGVAWIGETGVGCSTSTRPNIYARVRYYLDWIHEVTQIPPLPKPTTTTTTTTSTTTTTTTRPTTTSTTTTRPTTTTTRAPTSFNCKGKVNGLYPNPASTCEQNFYKCSNGLAYLYYCAPGDTFYNPARLLCDYRENVPGCYGINP